MATPAIPRKITPPSLHWQEGMHPLSITPLGESVVIGRDAAACDVLLDDERASRRHARIMTDPEGHAFLTDLGSSNGTFVNGRRVTRVQLADGDRLGFGAQDAAHCIFRATAPPEEAQAAPQVDASEAATAALAGGLTHCPFCRRLMTSDLGMCRYCAAMDTRSKLDESAAAAFAVRSPASCDACGAEARDWGDFCHRCGARRAGG